MTSLALYRRWRPQTFAEVLGQDHVTGTLRAAIRDDRVAHAYLFSGPRGTGKTSTARILAKALNCERGPAPEPCNACDTCRAVTEGSSLDVIEIDAATHGGVDDVRDLRENALLAPASARRKVYIIDEAHMITTAGWNAFLKTMEEPPAHVMFVFATTEPHKVLATISSRCQRFDFRRVPAATIAGHLAKVCADEGVVADEPALHLVARHAEGGVRDALSTLDQLVAAGSVTAEAAASLLGSATVDVLTEFAGALAARDLGAAVSLIGRLVEEGRDLRLFVRQVLDHMRSLFLLREIERPEDLVDVTEETLAALQAQSDRFTSAQLLHLVRLFLDAQSDMRQQASPRLALELSVVRATVPEADDSAQAALSRIERLERLLDLGGAGAPRAEGLRPARERTEEPAAEPARHAESAAGPDRKRAKKSVERTASGGSTKVGGRPEAPAGETPEDASSAGEPPTVGDLVDIEKVRRSWPVVLEEVRRESARIHALLAETTPAGWNEQTLLIEARYPFHAEQIAESRNADVIAEAVRRVYGVSPAIETRVADGPTEVLQEEKGGESDPLEALREGLGAEVIEDA